MPKLKKDDITLKEMIEISSVYYKKIDNKKSRAKMDIVNARLEAKKNYAYDRGSKTWKQLGKRHIKFEFIVRSDPTSYNKIDTVNIHKYPVTFVFFDLTLGINSPFKWRTGSLKRPILPKKGAKLSMAERVSNANQNIKRGKQLNFFFNLENILKRYGLLYGVDTTNGKLPKKSNNTFMPYFDKTAWFIIDKILLRLLSGKNLQMLANKLTANE